MPATMVRDVMTRDPVTLDASASVVEAARVMRERDIGNVIVAEGSEACSVLTDRDIVLRAVATGRDLTQVRLGDICSRGGQHVTPNDSLEYALEMMREHALRRLPVLDEGKAVGVVSMKDLAVAA